MKKTLWAWVCNEWVASNRIFVFVQRTLGSSGGKHCKLLEGKLMYSEKLFWGTKKRFWREINTFSPSFYRKWIWITVKYVIKSTDKLPYITRVSNCWQLIHWACFEVQDFWCTGIHYWEIWRHDQLGLLSNRPQVFMVCGLMDRAGCWRNARRIRESRAAGEWLTNSSSVLPASQVVYHAFKP